jgi:hypothetical protein
VRVAETCQQQNRSSARKMNETCIVMHPSIVQPSVLVTRAGHAERLCSGAGHSIPNCRWLADSCSAHVGTGSRVDNRADPSPQNDLHPCGASDPHVRSRSAGTPRVDDPRDPSGRIVPAECSPSRQRETCFARSSEQNGPRVLLRPPEASTALPGGQRLQSAGGHFQRARHHQRG